MKVAVTLELDPEEVAGLTHYAILKGYLRENPRKANTEKMRKEAVRYALEAFAVEVGNREKARLEK